MNADLAADLAKQDANHTRLVQEAAALGTKPEARDIWELAHQAAGIAATIRSRLQQQRWTA